jgi:NAD(P)-dependent dehydrogenase (short-subunit alcohol dehydrogenase family)
MASPSRAVLITGCSSGIGRATAIHLAPSWTVYATARRPESIADLEGRGCRLLTLDVTDHASAEAAVKEIEDRHGAVGVLVNNAGYGLHGAVETVSLDDARREFETNFFGLADLTQLVLPGMRAQGAGRIVNISSMGGKVSLPGGGFYHSSKFAVEALSDALRFELRAFGIHVIVIEPGLVKTEFGNTAVDTVGDHSADGPYGSFNAALQAKISSAYEGLLAKTAASPEGIAKLIGKAIAAPRPRTRYVKPMTTRVLLFAKRVLPDRAFDAILRSQYPSPSPRDKGER